MLIVGIIATLRIERLFLSSGILVECFEYDIILTEQVLIFAKTFQQGSLGESASSLALRGGHTLGTGFDAIYARKLARACGNI